MTPAPAAEPDNRMLRGVRPAAMPVPPEQHATDPDRTGNAKRRLSAVLLGALLVSGAWLWVDRGVLRGAAESKDFTMIYAGARLWFTGGNPYDFDDLYATFQEAGGTDERPADPSKFVSLYPPTTYAALSPLGALSWPAARVAWLGINVVAFFVSLAVLWNWRPRGPDTSIAWLAAALLAAWLWFAPAHTTLRFGQPGLVTLAMVLLAVGWPGRRGTGTGWQPAPWLAGLLLAVAGAIKPQLVGLFVLALLPVGRWRDVLWCVGLGLGFVGLSVLRLAFTAPTWFANLRQNLADFTGTGFADPTANNPFAWQMINLQPLLHRFTDNGTAVTTGVAVLVLVTLVVVTAASRRGATSLAPASTWERTLTLLSVAAALSLLVTYHRAYDAVLLAIPGVWVWRRLHADRRDALAWIAALCVMLFMVPGGSILRIAVGRGHLPEALRDSWAGGTFAMHHANWAVLVLWVTLLAVLLRGPAPTPPGTATPA